MGKPRKKYRPRWKPNNLGHLTAIRGVALLTMDDVLDMTLKPSLAVQAIAEGRSQQADWQTMFECCNLFEQLIKKGHADDPDNIVDDVQTVIVDVLKRRSNGTLALYANELATLKYFCALYSQLLETLTNRELFEAYEAMVRRVERVMNSRDPDVTYVKPFK